MGDLPHEGISRRSEPHLRVAVERLVPEQVIQRSNDGGQSWEPAGNQFTYEAFLERTNVDGTPHRGSSSVWHLEPSLDDPDVIYAGVEDAALFRSTDGAKTWQEMPGLRGHGSGRRWTPGRRSVPAYDPRPDERQPDVHRHFRRRRIPHGRWRPELDADWPGTALAIHPDPNAEVGHCVHRLGMHPSRPNVLFMQKHWDVMRSDNAGDLWTEVSGNLPTDFGFVLDMHAHEPETIYVVPIKSDSEHYPPDGKLRVYRSRSGGNEWERCRKVCRRRTAT